MSTRLTPRRIPGIPPTEVMTLNGLPMDPTACIAWSAASLIACASDSIIYLFDAETMQLCLSLDQTPTTPHAITILRWAPATCRAGPRQAVACGNRAGIVVVWDVLMASMHMTFHPPRQDEGYAVVNLFWVSDTEIYVHCENGSISSYDLIKGHRWRWLYEDPSANPGLFHRVTVSGTWKSLASITTHARVVVASVDCSQPKQTPSGSFLMPTSHPLLEGAIFCDLAFHEKERNILLLLGTEKLFVADTDTRLLLTSMELGPCRFSGDFLISITADHLITSTADGTVVVRSCPGDALTALCASDFRVTKVGSAGRVHSLCSSPWCPTTFFARSFDGTCAIWEMNASHKTGWDNTRLLELGDSTVSHVCFIHATNYVVVATGVGHILLYDSITSRLMRRMECFPSHHTTLTVHALPGEILLSGVRTLTNAVKRYSNVFLSIDFTFFQQKYVRPLPYGKDGEPNLLSDVVVSYSGKFALLCFCTAFVEVWDLSKTKLKRKFHLDFVKVSWCPPKMWAEGECALFVHDNGTFSLRVATDKDFREARSDVASKQQHLAFFERPVRGLDWFEASGVGGGYLLIHCDTSGDISLTNLLTGRRSRLHTIPRASPKKITVASNSVPRISTETLDEAEIIVSSTTTPYVLILFDNKCYGTWDLHKRARVAYADVEHIPSLAAVDVAWGSNLIVVVLTVTGSLLFLPLDLSVSNTPFSSVNLCGKISTPYFLQSIHALRLHAYLSHVGEVDNEEDLLDPEVHSLVELPPHLDRSKGSIPYEAVAAYFGDADEVRFWQSVREVLDRAQGLPDAHYPLVPFAAPTVEEAPRDSTRLSTGTQPHSISLVRDTSALHFAHLRGTAVAGAGHYHSLGAVSREYTKANEMRRALDVLLTTPPTHHEYLVNALTACVMAAAIDTERDLFRNRVALVATALVKQGRTDLGVQLLCTVGMRAEACDSLISVGCWRDAVNLAGSLEDAATRSTILRRIARDVCSMGSASNVLDAASLLVSDRQYVEVLKVLATSSVCADVAALFARRVFGDGEKSYGCTYVSDDKDLKDHLIQTTYDTYAQMCGSIGLSALTKCYRSFNT